jgi:hypothetical protein
VTFQEKETRGASIDKESNKQGVKSYIYIDRKGRWKRIIAKGQARQGTFSLFIFDGEK